MEKILNEYISQDVIKYIIKPMLGEYFLITTGRETFLVFDTEENVSRICGNIDILDSDMECIENKFYYYGLWHKESSYERIKLDTTRTIMDKFYNEYAKEFLKRNLDWSIYNKFQHKRRASF